MPSPSPNHPQGLSTVLVAVLAFGAAGFGFGAYFYLVPFQRKAAQLDRAQKELAARPHPAQRSRVEVEALSAAARIEAQLKSLKGAIEEKLTPSGATVTVGPTRLLVRFPEENIFEARGPWLSKAGTTLVEELGAALGERTQRVVISAPMGSGTVPRWVKGQLPTPADLSAARAGSALKALVKGGVRADVVLAVVGSLAAEGGDALPTLDFEIEVDR